MRIGPHHHPCSTCGAKTECCGELQQNYDGFPEWVCREYHGLVNHTYVIDTDFRCDRCDEFYLRVMQEQDGSGWGV